MRAFTTLYLSIFLSFNLCSQNLDFSNTDFRKADSVAMHYANHSLHDLKSLAEKLTNPFQNDIEKFRSIYFWVCNNIDSDYYYYLLNERQREKFQNRPDQLIAWNVKFSKRVYERLLHEKKTVCTGYAYLIRELSYWAGLTSIIIDGYGRSAKSNIGGPGTPNHSWNAVQLNDQWFLCDATWSSGSINPKSGVFTKKFDTSYFLPDPTLFIRNHYPLDTSKMFLKNKPLLLEFLGGPIVYKGTYKYHVNPVSPKMFNVTATKDECVSFQFKKDSRHDIQEVALQINGRKVSKNISSNHEGQYAIEYIFKNKGNHIVHLLLDSNYILTYVVEVN